VKEVADRLGFPEQFTFRKYFKTHTGISPTEYRKGNKMCLWRDVFQVDK